MTAITEPLDRVAQSHIEGRVRHVVRENDRFTWISGYKPSPFREIEIRNPTHRCYHCGAAYNDTLGYYAHAHHCPYNQRGPK